MIVSVLRRLLISKNEGFDTAYAPFTSSKTCSTASSFKGRTTRMPCHKLICVRMLCIGTLNRLTRRRYSRNSANICLQLNNAYLKTRWLSRPLVLFGRPFFFFFFFFFLQIHHCNGPPITCQQSTDTLSGVFITFAVCNCVLLSVWSMPTALQR